MNQSFFLFFVFRFFFFFFFCLFVLLLLAVVAGRRLTGITGCFVQVVMKKDSWPKHVLFESKTQVSNFGSAPVFNEDSFQCHCKSVTYCTLVFTVMACDEPNRPMYEYRHDMSAFKSVQGWVDLTSLTGEKILNNLPPQLNLSIEFHYKTGPLHLLLLKPYLSDADLEEVYQKTGSRSILSPSTEQLNEWLSKMKPNRAGCISILRLAIMCLIIIGLYVVAGVLLFGYRMGQ
jgi:hypothetical protein